MIRHHGLLVACVLVSVPLIASAQVNDNCSGAVAANLGATPYNNLPSSTDGAAVDPSVCDMGPFGDEQIYDDVWFLFTSPTTGNYEMEVVFGGTGFPDTRLAVYDSSSCPGDAAGVIACDDDSGAGLLSRVSATLAMGSTYLIRLGNFEANTTGAVGDLVITSVVDYSDLCNGDGGNQAGCTNCPCGNNAGTGTIGGCLNSAGNSARLLSAGSASVSLPPNAESDLRFALSGVPANAFCILNSGDAVAPGNMANPCFGMGSGVQAVQFDGLRCAIMNTRRHGGRAADASGDVGVTNDPWGGEAAPPAGLASAGGGFASGQTRFFQVINRDDPFLACMRGLNTSQAVEVVFVP